MFAGSKGIMHGKHNKVYKAYPHTLAVLDTTDTMTTEARLKQHNSIDNIIAKVELGSKIAQIALACPTCRIPVNKEIQDFKSKNCHQEGGHSLLPATNGHTEGLINEYSTSEYK